MTVVGMGGGRGRAAYAYRDLDEELAFPVIEHAYHSQESPVSLAKPLSESVILRSHFDKTQVKRRRLLYIIGGGLVLLLGSSALLLLTKTMESQRHRSPLELTIGAPYGALRGKGDVKPSVHTPLEGELFDLLNAVDLSGPDVGDADPTDVHHHHVLGMEANAAKEQEAKAAAAVAMEEDNDESDLYYYDRDDDEEDRPWRGHGGYLHEEQGGKAKPVIE
ncbi:hypothetical protein Gpo141_00009773 [Globisporangium polare]